MEEQQIVVHVGKAGYATTVVRYPAHQTLMSNATKRRVQKSATPVSLAQFVKQEDSTSVDPGHTVMEQDFLVSYALQEATTTKRGQKLVTAALLATAALT